LAPVLTDGDPIPGKTVASKDGNGLRIRRGETQPVAAVNPKPPRGLFPLAFSPDFFP